jgi:twinkle protein
VSTLVKSKLPCPCGTSSDAYSLYSDGHGYCHSAFCKKPYHPPPDQEVTTEEVYTYEYIPIRGLSRETLERYGVRTKVDAKGVPVSLGFPYGDQSTKVRALDRKEFTFSNGKGAQPLFGMDRFSAGSHKYIFITEGEFDAMTLFQLTGYPAVSVQSGSSAKKDCVRAFDYLDSFERVYLCFDNDEAGQKALEQVLPMFAEKAFVLQLSQYKDANEYLQNDAQDDLIGIWKNTKRHVLENVVSSFDEFEECLNDDAVVEGIPYPFPSITQKTYGIRFGEIVLVTALEGRGKTEFVRAIEHSILKNTDHNLGIIHLEEGVARNLKGLAGYDLGKPIHLPDHAIPPKDVTDVIKRLAGRDDRLHIYKHFGSDDPDALLAAVRYLVTVAGCRIVVLDHITMVVSGLGMDDERKVLDYLSTRLRMLVEELNFALVLVSHINDDGKTRGSRNISKVANIWIKIDRDVEAETLEERNTSYITLGKNRFAAETGPVCKLYFDRETFRLSEVKPATLPPAGTQ